MKKAISIIVIISFLYLLSSCATLFKGTSEDVNFSSDPQRAEVWVNGVKMGETPMALKLECKKTYTIEFKKEGFETVTKTITNHVGLGWILLDIWLFYVPLIVDAVTGAWYYLDQKNVDAILKKQQPVS